MSEPFYLFIERPQYEWHKIIAKDKEDAVTKAQSLFPKGIVQRVQTEKPKD